MKLIRSTRCCTRNDKIKIKKPEESEICQFIRENVKSQADIGVVFERMNDVRI
jgi:hypothetical protein